MKLKYVIFSLIFLSMSKAVQASSWKQPTSQCYCSFKCGWREVGSVPNVVEKHQWKTVDTLDGKKVICMCGDRDVEHFYDEDKNCHLKPIPSIDPSLLACNQEGIQMVEELVEQPKQEESFIEGLKKFLDLE